MAKRLSAVSKHAAVILSLVAVPVTLKLEKVSASVSKPKPPAAPQPVHPTFISTRIDPRVQRVRSFLSSLHCPVSNLAEDFVEAADDNQIDWRLLPSISVIESGGGKAYKNNNIFGWANGDYLFPTIRTAIHQVAFKLGKSALYRNRGVEEKLHLYNPDSAYAGNVMNVMNRISPVVNLRPIMRRELAYVSD